VGLRRGSMGFMFRAQNPLRALVPESVTLQVGQFSSGYQDVGIHSTKPVLHQRRPASSSVQVPVQVESSTTGTFGWPWRRSVADCDVAKGRAFGGDRFWIGRVRPVGPSSVPFSA
jgi:hypothetical protein